MEEYFDGDALSTRNEMTDYQEWCEAQDARELDAYPDPRDMGLCIDGLHPFGTCGCDITGAFGSDSDIPF